MKTVTNIMLLLVIVISCVVIQAKIHEAATIVRRQATQPDGKKGVEDKYKFGVGMYMDLGPGPFGYGMPYGGGYGMPYGGGYGMPYGGGYGMPFGGGGGGLGGYGMPYGGGYGVPYGR